VTGRTIGCGPTVYDFAHIGNFRAYVWKDLLRRTLKFIGFKVTQVMNITDIEDKIIQRSIAEDLDSLNIERASRLKQQGFTCSSRGSLYWKGQRSGEPSWVAPGVLGDEHQISGGELRSPHRRSG
jgi:hypothetical protein